jgi:hypothetical protein
MYYLGKGKVFHFNFGEEEKKAIWLHLQSKQKAPLDLTYTWKPRFLEENGSQELMDIRCLSSVIVPHCMRQGASKTFHNTDP